MREECQCELQRDRKRAEALVGDQHQLAKYGL